MSLKSDAVSFLLSRQYIMCYGPVAKFQCVAIPGAAEVGPPLKNKVASLYSRRKNTLHLKCSVWHVLPTYEYCTFLFTQVDLVLNKVDLAGIIDI